jgi:3-oxoacyl-[acyl-carrier protein] reductase
LNLNLKNKNFLITGSSRGIGKSIAEGFLVEEANVGLVARTLTTLKQTAELLQSRYKSNVMYWIADLINESAVNELSDRILREWESIDGLVVNVGSGKSLSGPVTDSWQWDSVWDTNFNTALNTVRAFLPSLKKNNGCVVFISSICGIEALGTPTDYSVAKSALNAFSKNLAKKVGPDVRVNTVAPGNIYFEGGTWDKKIKENEILVDEMLKSEVPLKRFGAPEEVADAVTFLCSERASFITGSTLVVDGGQTRSF